MLRAAGVACLSVLLPAAVALASEGPTNELAACLDRAAAVLVQESDARPMDVAGRAFLTEGASRTVSLALRSGGCVGILAVGHARVEELDVAMFTAGGIRLRADAATGAHGHVRYCGAPGLKLVVVLRVAKGQGEVRWRAFEDAPARLPDLERRVGACFGGHGGVQHKAADVGPPPAGGDVEALFRGLRNQLEGRGYGRLRQRKSGQLIQGGAARHPVRLEARRCYAFATAGDAGVRDMDLVVRDAGGRVVARDVDRRRDALARACTERGGPHVVELRMHRGSGAWALGVFELTALPDDAPPGVRGRARARHGEMVARMARRGLGAAPVTWAHLSPEVPLRVPVRLSTGRCYGFGAVRSDALARGDSDLVLADPEGRTVARDLGPGPEPLLFHCPEREGTYALHVRVRGAVGSVLLLRGGGER